MNVIVEEALCQWGMSGARYKLVASRENAVYEVLDARGRFALRLHRQGYRSDAELRSELAWMAAVAEGGLSVPSPALTVGGECLAHIDGMQVDVLTWLRGRTLDDALAKCAREIRRSLFFALGREMALLHQVSDAWDPPQFFERVHWDRDGLLGRAPLWDRFWENPELTASDRGLAERFRRAASDRLEEIEPTLDYGLVHADLVPGNVLVDSNVLRLIDFDDGGFGYRLFDVATALLKHMPMADYPRFRIGMIEGYHSIRPLDVAELDLFLALRSATYVGWNITRIGEADGAARNRRFIDLFRSLARKCLQKGSVSASWA
ncbi:MAG: phosphotransferase [Boseongicola sp. SB0676_bin_33]|uniref:Phosphotransferase n=1 Tax=Boseongicola sp. SB0664_bin_43 TaxID=2604844 RepID=A0A6B0Y1H2_9RHOB|nr:phosphotransferase [Boseongicola sp. SB0664_bin_43]MYF89202.1 phosphotransferase [Boseongicola sp. SB0676_bin_33]MYK33512.1 phosphotransferase [Boseongicola sp. SB0670_bin_30]